MQGFALLAINYLHLVAAGKKPKIVPFTSIEFKLKADATAVQHKLCLQQTIRYQYSFSIADGRKVEFRSVQI
jgi:hypothetical protein